MGKFQKKGGKEMKKRLIVLLAGLIAVLVLVSACRIDRALDLDMARTDADGNLIVAIMSLPAGLDQTRNDSASALVGRQIYSTLVWLQYDEYEASFSPQPSLATDWYMPDASTVVMRLRSDVYFHDGVQLTAYDVQHSLERSAQVPEAAVVANMISHVTVQDEFNFTIHLEFPFVPIVNNLGHTIMGIVPRHISDEELAEHPIGSGPFMFEYIALGDYVQLSRNPNYWGEPALVETLRFNLIADSSVRVIETDLGSVHIGMDILAPDVASAESSTTATLMRRDNLSMNYIGFNMLPYNTEDMPRPTGEPNPFADWRVRHAINYALDVEAIIDSTLFGLGRPLAGPLSDVNPDFIPGAVEPFDFNLERARELMAEAGWEDGFDAVFWFNVPNAVREATGVMVQFMLQQININVIDVMGLDWTVYLDRTGNFEHDMFMLGWVSVVGDLDYAFHPIFHSENLGPGGNRFYLNSPELDDILDRARVELDPEVRSQLYIEAQQLLREYAPMALVNQGETAIHVHESVGGLVINPAGHHNFAKVYFR